MGTIELRLLKELEEENKKLKQLVADLSLDKHILHEVVRKKTLKPAVRRILVEEIALSFTVGTVEPAG